jgi:hypothetical protein
MKMSRLEYTWAEAAMAAIFPGSNDHGLAGIDRMDVRGYLGEVMRRVPFKAALGLRVAVWLVALAPLFVLGRFATIARLSQADRERVVARLVASKSYVLRSLVLIIKTIGALLYAGDDAVRMRMLAPRPGPLAQPLAKPLVQLRVKRSPAVA